MNERDELWAANNDTPVRRAGDDEPTAPDDYWLGYIGGLRARLRAVERETGILAFAVLVLSFGMLRVLQGGNHAHR